MATEIVAQDTQAKIRVLLVDDHPPFRIGMRVLLEQNPAIAVVGEAGTGGETLRLVAQLQPDVVVLDCQLPDMDGPAVAAALRQHEAPVRVLALSAELDYAPHGGARGLATTQTHTVAFLTLHRSLPLNEDFFYQRIMLGAQQELARLIKKRYGIEAAIPDYLEEVTLEPGREPARVEYPEKAAPRIDWDFLIADMETRFAQIRERRQAVEDKPWIEQTEFRDRLLEVNRNLAGIISEI